MQTHERCTCLCFFHFLVGIRVKAVRLHHSVPHRLHHGVPHRLHHGVPHRLHHGVPHRLHHGVPHSWKWVYSMEV